jgi:hypothetical protein
VGHWCTGLYLVSTFILWICISGKHAGWMCMSLSNIACKTCLNNLHKMVLLYCIKMRWSCVHVCIPSLITPRTWR